MFLLCITLLLISSAWTQEHNATKTKSVSGVPPEPEMIIMPYDEPVMPDLKPAEVAEVNTRTVKVDAPVLDLSKEAYEEVFIPNPNITMPRGGTEILNFEYRIPQTVIDTPKPIFVSEAEAVPVNAKPVKETVSSVAPPQYIPYPVPYPVPQVPYHKVPYPVSHPVPYPMPHPMPYPMPYSHPGYAKHPGYGKHPHYYQPPMPGYPHKSGSGFYPM